ncbi:hypothetical protein C2L65_41935 [Paraburkholderia terrae]|uniref:Uncharacterized protein n=1 Tax=Paraburkholderia terrae TaxID=311230 RepID=A0A2I8F3J1_9BURK|nr:hypothetical protein C2L65_41935 [Paraburkholderia terrae]
MAVQQGVVQVGMQVVGTIDDKLQERARDAQKQAYQDYVAAEAADDTDGMAKAQADYNAASQQFALWGNDGAGRIGSHAVVAAVGAAMGGRECGGRHWGNGCRRCCRQRGEQCNRKHGRWDTAVQHCIWRSRRCRWRCVGRCVGRSGRCAEWCEWRVGR